MKFIFLTCFPFLLGCQSNNGTDHISRSVDSTVKVPQLLDDNKLLQVTVDSTTIGNKGQNMVALAEYGTDSSFVVIDFFTKGPDNNWVKDQSFSFIQPPVDAEMKTEDYNGDGLMDISYRSETSARGANELRSVFIYDGETGNFTYLKNSHTFPNLSYDTMLGCLEAMYFYGSSCNSFLKIQGDSLREFISAPVEHENDNKYYREVYFIDNAGNRKLLERKKIDDDRTFDSYTNHELIKKYKNR